MFEFSFTRLFAPMIVLDIPYRWRNLAKEICTDPDSHRGYSRRQKSETLVLKKTNMEPLPSLFLL
jgi:hypothetical protein